MLIAAVVPCYKVEKQISDVVNSLDSYCDLIIVVDDCCPNHSAKYINYLGDSKKLIVVRHDINKGVGGAVMTGYATARSLGADIVVKIDGDGQMDSSLIPRFTVPIINGLCDYTKGNRFYTLDMLKSMPKIRIFGNSVLSLMSRFSSGYWNITDPTNGFTAISTKLFDVIDFKKISKRYYFESDMLFRLFIAGAVVRDVPMVAKYGNEVSNLKINKIIFDFISKSISNATKRFFYMYILRGMSPGTLFGIFGPVLTVIGVIHGFREYVGNSVPNTPGSVVLTALMIILGVQFTVAFMAEDMNKTPKTPISPYL